MDDGPFMIGKKKKKKTAVTRVLSIYIYIYIYIYTLNSPYRYFYARHVCSARHACVY